MKTIYISGEIGYDITADWIREQIDSNSKERLRVILNSIGGSINDGFEIYNIFKAYKGDIEMVIGVMAASITSYIAMAVPAEKRKGFKNSSFMVHEASRAAYGRARDFLTIYERLEGLNTIVSEAYAEGMKLSKEEARDMMREDKYFTGWEALIGANIISNVIDIEDIDIPKKEEDEQAFIIFDTFMKEMQRDDFDINVYKEKMYTLEDKINSDIKKSQDDICKAAAKLKLDKIKPESNTDNSVDDKILIMEDNKMPKLDELLKSNPEAQAEYTANLQAAEQRAKDEAMQMNDVGKERGRIFNILKFSGINISEDTSKAINEGTDSAQFAQDELMRERNKRKDQKSGVDFGKLVNRDLPGDQDEKGKEEAEINAGDEKAKLEAFDKKLDEASAKKSGKEVK